MKTSPALFFFVSKKKKLNIFNLFKHRKSHVHIEKFYAFPSSRLYDIIFVILYLKKKTKNQFLQ